MQSVKKLLEQLRTVLGSMSTTAKVVSATLIAVVAGGLLFITTVDRTEYQPLFTGLSTEDASKIVEQLRKDKVLYKLEAGGTAILVPQDKVHDTRLDLAGKGLPRGGGVGFEIFDNQKFGISDFAQQVNYRRAIQGELERTITELDAVRAARVHVAMPKHQLFARKQQPVSASVTLRLHPGRTLSQGSVKAIVHLVSSAVTGLRPDNVTVVDTGGTMLWTGDGGADSPSKAADFKQGLEDRLERRVNEIVAAAVGPGHSVVKVTAEIGTTHLEQMDTEFDPDKTAVRSESKLEEKDGAKSASAAGIPGVRGNLPGGPEPQQTGRDAGSSRKRLTRNFEVNKIVRKRISPAGELKRVSVAVLIDSKIIQTAAGAAPGAAGARPEAKKAGAVGAGAALAMVDLKALEDVVKKAVGFSADRGDLVTLQVVPFAPETEIDAPTVSWPLRLLSGGGNLASAVIGAAVIAAVVFVLLRRRRRSSAETAIQLPMTVKEIESKAPVPQRLALGEGDVQARDLAAAAAEHDSRRAAAVLRAWLAEG